MSQLWSLGHAPGYQQKFWPKFQFSEMFEIQLKQFKSYTRGCICDIENKILQKKLFLTPLWSYGQFSFSFKNSILAQKIHKMAISQERRQK